ncbi:hypothetical protein JG687_00004899 [Phytophthora cactorum]|uniref:Ankyrin repeat-containing domain n=1 Tax=Phytophthora cactorum TaxID=29920 RepID=A0A8T1US06_9STRA|nr:hypothetical protein JG687_00004899 [Phytophthora cactorum]
MALLNYRKAYGKSLERDGADSNVRWGDRIVLLAAEQGHFEVVRWLCEHTVEEEEKYDETCDEVMKHVLKFGDDDLTKFLLHLADAC